MVDRVPVSYLAVDQRTYPLWNWDVAQEGAQGVGKRQYLEPLPPASYAPHRVDARACVVYRYGTTC